MDYTSRIDEIGIIGTRNIGLVGLSALTNSSTFAVTAWATWMASMAATP
jgi:hypothetical protein